MLLSTGAVYGMLLAQDGFPLSVPATAPDTAAAQNEAGCTETADTKAADQ